ncbi:MAG: hypothetical protein K2N44_19850 [Lachnospiraceae bacterium]|nr:hypothetical protein [Lachnospiraceae bacterium]
MNKGMTLKDRKKTLEIILAIFVLCSVIKEIEFLVIKTDQTIISENIICKLFVIAVLFIALSKLGWNWKKIGFCKEGLLKNAVLADSWGKYVFFPI